MYQLYYKTETRQRQFEELSYEKNAFGRNCLATHYVYQVDESQFRLLALFKRRE